MPAEAKDIFEARSQSLLELLWTIGQGLYLPAYQRPYGWSKDKVERLLDDTLHGLAILPARPDSFTFLGTIITIEDKEHLTVDPLVKNEVPSGVLVVIDGQQRLSSLLVLIACLHNQIRQLNWSVFKGNIPDPENEALASIHDEAVVLLKALANTLYENYQIGDSPLYPRLIRAIEDSWAKKSKYCRYESPIAHFLFTYAQLAEYETGKPTDFRPKPREHVGNGEKDLIDRYDQMRRIIAKLAAGKKVGEFDDLPAMSVLADNVRLQQALFNHPLHDSLCAFIKDKNEGDEIVLMRLLMMAGYVLNRIALTVVRGKDEDYAFTIFEALNTTGEPLTAFETFKPRVIRCVGDDYQESSARAHISDVEAYLSRFAVGNPLQKATQELLVSFALAESGTKLSKRLADQRTYMREAFDRCSDDEDGRDAFLRHLRDTANFINATWNPADGNPSLPGLDADAMTDTVRLCLAFLTALNHTVVIAPLVRFYSAAVSAEAEQRKARAADFESALKAITAFTVFWRASRRSTGRIDSQYREVMAGTNLKAATGPLARTGAAAVDVNLFRAELAARLQDEGELPNLATFVDRAKRVPVYLVNKHLARFLLLAAYHDAVEDARNPGLITQGRTAVAACFTAAGWADEAHLTIEHVAPQSGATTGWDPNLYMDRDTIHTLGNLVLTPHDANSSLGARPWEQKRVLYNALGAKSHDEAKKVLTEAKSNGIEFQQSTEELVQLSKYLPHLTALSRRDQLDVSFVEERAANLLKLVYARLGSWLDLKWSVDGDEEVVPFSPDHDASDDDEEFEIMD